MNRLLFRICRGAWDLVFPPSCRHCGQELGDPLDGNAPRLLFCPDCLAEMPIYGAPFCCRCGCGSRRNTAEGCPACLSARFRFDEAIALGHYESVLRTLVLRMKQGIDETTSLAVGQLIWSVCRDRLLATQSDVVIPVPMYWSRRLARGTNSAALLAELLAGRLGLPYADHLLYRRRNTLPQSELPPSERDRNLRDALAIRASYAFGGARVLLVDDIMTTGATANAAARALKSAGAGHVSLAVVARSPANWRPEGLLAPSAGKATIQVSPDVSCTTRRRLPQSNIRGQE